MKLKEHIEALQELVDNDTSLLELECFVAIDDEGNGYNKVHYSPDVFYVEKDINNFADYVLEEADFNGDDYDKQDFEKIILL